MARQNLLTNPNFSSSVSGWVGLEGATITHTHVGNRDCAQVTKTAVNFSGISTANYITVTAGLSYALSAYVNIPTGEATGNLAVNVTWYTYTASPTPTYEEIGSTSSDVISVATVDGWVRLTQVGVAPVGANRAKFRVYQTTAGTAGKKFLVDNALFEQSDYVGSFIDVLTQAEESERVNRALSTYRDLNHITGLQLNADVQISELVLNTIDEDDIVWICTDISGWWTTASPETPNIPRGFQDGSYDVSGRYAARDLTLTGVFIPQRPADVGIARDKLISAIDLVREGAWLRTSEEPTKASFVRLVDRPQIQTVNSRGRTEFSIPLRAGDPIKYKWDDTKIDGITVASIDLADASPNDYSTVTINNEGNATVTAKLVFTGPLGAGSTVSIYHEDTRTTETLTTIEALRGAGPVATVTDVEITNNVALVTTQEAHGLSVGETISVSSTISNKINTTQAVISSVTDTLPYTVSYTIPGTTDDLAKTESSGTISLVSADEMIVDTYNRNVTVNGDSTGYRSKLDTLTDWVSIQPGVNILTFTDSIDTSDISNKAYDSVNNQITLTTTGSHFLKVSDSVSIEFPTQAEVAYKELAGGVVTITTAVPHGFSIGDEVKVETTLDTLVTNKSLSSNTATLTVSDSTAISDNDTVAVQLSSTAQILYKQRTGSTVTLTTSNSATGHGFSNGDSVTIPFSVDAYVKYKSLTGNVALIETQSAHNFSEKDQVDINLPETTVANQKTISGTQVTLATSSAHGFSVGDLVTVDFPETATLSNTRRFGGSGYFNTTYRESSGTTRTITTSGVHNFTTNDYVYITNVSNDYNGTYQVTGTPSTTTFTYTAGTSVNESSTVAEGSVTNTTMSYRVRLTTSAAHEFVVGDSIQVDIGIDDEITVTNRSATTTECTLTSAGHKYSVGEVINVSGVDARFDGTFSIKSVTTDTITYEFAGSAVSPAVSSSGTIINYTIRNGYNGTKVIDSVTSTTLTYLYYGQNGYTASTSAGTSATLDNLTNQAINGTNLVLTSAYGTTLQYTRTV